MNVLVTRRRNLQVYGTDRGGHPALPTIMPPRRTEDRFSMTNLMRICSDGHSRRRGIKVVVPLVADVGTNAALLLGQKLFRRGHTDRIYAFCRRFHELVTALRTCELFEQREQRVRELTALNRLASSWAGLQLEALLTAP